MSKSNSKKSNKKKNKRTKSKYTTNLNLAQLIFSYSKIPSTVT